MRLKSSRILATLLILPLITLIGCGGPSGPPTYPVSGKVTYDGQPVPYGTIMFEPDPDKGGAGPTGFAVIQNGQYQTADEKGSVGGSIRIRISGADGKQPDGPDKDMYPHGKELFPEYVTTVDMPTAETTQDFEVPKAE